MAYATCHICEKEFYVKPSHVERGWGKYCSMQCRTIGQYRGETVPCTQCGKAVYRAKGQLRHSKSKKFFCSKSCQAKWRNSFFSEEKHANWLGGEHAYRNILMRSGREQVCISCGTADIRILSAHHIDHNRKNNKLSNLVWVCLNCHYLLHHDEDFENGIKKTIEGM